MKTVFVLFDSLNRLALECYGGTHIKTPNFKRFAEKSITFDNHYVGSLPCMPARRDLHTGRLNFLHRSWGPLEPFDNSFPEILRDRGIYSHIVTDHHHYFADGGATYHQRYSSWDLIRGQAIDRWKPKINLTPEEFKDLYHPMQQHRRAYMVNRQHIVEEKDFPCPQIFNNSFEFLNTNKDESNWLLQIECFDPHEPFYAPDRFRKQYSTDYEGPILDWPIYDRVKESPEEISELRANYAALLSMCDEYFGKLLDYFDEHNLWRDTAIVLTTDHGFLLGEHDWWAKNRMPVYQEIAHIPLVIYHPDFADKGGERRSALTQTTDIMPTLLDIHGTEIPFEVTGHSLLPLLSNDTTIRDTAMFGFFGASCNITDGQHVYFRYPESLTAENLFEYTLMPTRMTSRFAIDELVDATLSPPFSFSKGVPLLRLKTRENEEGLAVECQGMPFEDCETALYNLVIDPKQKTPINDPIVERRLAESMKTHMKEADAPNEMYARLGIDLLSD
ncbi:MAG TPA: sulfatase [Rhodospirillales bacterium]|jgi:arylsulfatase A-like enzyme|nr:sulfatase [Rhodospirillales bacterium]HIL74592.1 sulfatase [Rhodospirillales bacterium]